MPRAFSPDDDAAIRRRYPHEQTAAIARDLQRSLHSVYSRARRCLGLRKAETFFSSPASGRLHGNSAGVSNRFQRGNVPPNKGLRRTGYYAGRKIEKQYVKGRRNGHAKENYVAIGTEHVNQQGYLVRKVTDEGRAHQRWAFVHHLIWIERHGPVPPGYTVGLINGNRRDVRLDNLVLLARADIARRNSVWNRYPREIALCAQLLGQIKGKINRRRREKQDD